MWIPSKSLKTSFSCDKPDPVLYTEMIDGECYAMVGMGRHACGVQALRQLAVVRRMAPLEPQAASRKRLSLASTNVDPITDFDAASDTIGLARAVFTQLAHTGALDAGAYFAGAAAHDADDRIVYNSSVR